MGRVSVLLPLCAAVIAVIIGVCQGYYTEEDHLNYAASRPAQVAVPMVYSNQPPLTSRQLLQQAGKKQPLYLARVGRSHNYNDYPSSSPSKQPRADEEADYYEEEAVAEDEHPSYSSGGGKRKKSKGKKKKEESLSFPRRMYKKTKNAISSTTAAVFGAPKYIYTRYRDTYGFGTTKKNEKKKSKGHKDTGGWGWDDEEDRRDDFYDNDNANNNNGWGWESNAEGSSLDDYERKTGGTKNNRNNHRNRQRGDKRPYRRVNKYAYTQPEEMREITPLSSLNAWVQ